MKRTGTTISQASAANSQTFVIQPAEVIRTLCKINARKAAGLDGILGCVLKNCAAELGEIFTNIFNLALLKCTVPTCLKTSTIVPVPKQAAITSLNDYRPIALRDWFCITLKLLCHPPWTLPSMHTGPKGQQMMLSPLPSTLYCAI